jgi:hypothetical protein
MERARREVRQLTEQLELLRLERAGADHGERPADVAFDYERAANRDAAAAALPPVPRNLPEPAPTHVVAQEDDGLVDPDHATGKCGHLREKIRLASCAARSFAGPVIARTSRDSFHAFAHRSLSVGLQA